MCALERRRTARGGEGDSTKLTFDRTTQYVYRGGERRARGGKGDSPKFTLIEQHSLLYKQECFTGKPLVKYETTSGNRVAYFPYPHK